MTAKKRKYAQPLRRQRNREKLIAMLADGETAVAIAEKIGVTKQAVSDFKARNLATIEPQVAALQLSMAEQLAEVHIANKVNRVKDAAALYEKLLRIIDSRALAYAEQPGGDTGLLTEEVKQSAKGDVVYTYRVDPVPLQELRALRREVAEELGQLQKDAPAEGTKVLIQNYGPAIDVTQLG